MKIIMLMEVLEKDLYRVITKVEILIIIKRLIYNIKRKT